MAYHDIILNLTLFLFSPDNASEGFISYYDNELIGIGRPQAIYVDVTSQVCRHVCVKLHSDSCCSVTYERATRTCYVTPMDMKASGAKLVPKTYVDYFHRRKCQGKGIAQLGRNRTIKLLVCYHLTIAKFFI